MTIKQSKVPNIGWMLFSREALSRAETQLRDDVSGVRDEIGFLLVHGGYANRFFPGTSVLHTRLRYALFIPWMYADLQRDAGKQDVARRVVEVETRLAGRLKNEAGTIGSRSYPNPTSQPPTFAYWTALQTWGLVKPRPDGSRRSKAEIHRALARRGSLFRMQDDEGHSLEEVSDFFIRTPDPPDAWHRPHLPINFALSSAERVFLRQQLLGVMKPGEGTPSYLSRLAENISELDLDRADHAWSKSVSKYADAEDQAALKRARVAAALADVGRAIYAALVEALREEDGLPTGKSHRDLLPEVLSRSAETALSLPLFEVLTDLPNLPGYLKRVLEETADWLTDPRDVRTLREVYAKAEENRKGRRSRLSRTFSGKERRAEWDGSQHTAASPLSYRWEKVCGLLRDLKGEP